MIELTQRIERGVDTQSAAQLPLAYELRQKRWLRATLPTGEEVSIRLSRGETLRSGDLLRAADGRVIEIVAAPEPVMQASFASLSELARAAYHLGNRHTPTQIGARFLRIQKNHVLEEMLRNMGAALTYTEAPFDPESGAYSGRHAHLNNEPPSGSIIHEYDTHASAGGKR